MKVVLERRVEGHRKIRRRLALGLLAVFLSAGCAENEDPDSDLSALSDARTAFSWPDGGVETPLPELTRCDVRSPDCATRVVAAVCALFGWPMPADLRVEIEVSEPILPDDANAHAALADRGVWSLVQRRPRVMTTQQGNATRPEDDPTLAEGPTPVPEGRVEYLPLETRLVFHTPEAPQNRSRRLLAGLVSGTLDALRHLVDPQSPLDQYSAAPLVHYTRRALKLGMAYVILAQIEAAMDGRPGRAEAVEAARDDAGALLPRAFDPDYTPGRWGHWDYAALKGLRWVAVEWSSGGFRSIHEQLHAFPDWCARRIFQDPEANCQLLAIADGSAPEGGEAYLTYSLYGEYVESMTATLAHVLPLDDAIELGMGLVGHLGFFRVRLEDLDPLYQDLYIWDTAAQAAAYAAWATTRAQALTDAEQANPERTERSLTRIDVRHHDRTVTVVHGGDDVDFEPFFNQMESVNVVEAY